MSSRLPGAPAVNLSSLSAILRTLEIHAAAPARDSSSSSPPPAQRLCWHCCHSWQGESIKFPVSQDFRLKRFRVVGQFCSWECVKGYNRDNYANIRNSIQDVNIRYYRKMMSGNVVPVPAAPPRSFLKAFGGKMDIDEFRKDFSHVATPERSLWSAILVQFDNKLTPVSETARKAAAVPAPGGDHVDFAGASCKNDSFRLRRPKPLAHAGRNGLERALGLNSLIKIKS